MIQSVFRVLKLTQQATDFHGLIFLKHLIVAEASRVADYDNTREKILKYWFRLLPFVLAFAMLATITLEFIDKDKR